ncbi:MAG: hypothetical protein AABX47_08650 [Nanoarchaeota archaeon]
MDIWTFERFAKWVKDSQPELDKAWQQAQKPGVVEGTACPRAKYMISASNLFKDQVALDRFHPRYDNSQLFLTSSIDESMDMFASQRFKTTLEEAGRSCPLWWDEPIDELVSPRYIRMDSSSGVMSLQVYEEIAGVDGFICTEDFWKGFVAASGDGIPVRCRMDRKDVAPNFRLPMRTTVLINPYAKRCFKSQRDNDRMMEDLTMGLMGACVSKGIGALYSSRGTSDHYVINLPSNTL